MRERERDGRMGYREREWRDLMFDMSGSKIKGAMKREPLHAAHTLHIRWAINCRLGVTKRKFSFQHSFNNVT